MGSLILGESSKAARALRCVSLSCIGSFSQQFPTFSLIYIYDVTIRVIQLLIERFYEIAPN